MIATPVQPPVGRNMALQGLRGIAASAVVVYHAAHFTASRLNAPWLESIFNGNFGYFGVLTFFVLSGFLMESAIRRYSPGTFLLHRCARLFPTYWLIFLALYFAQAVRLHSFENIPWAALSLLPLGEMFRPLGVEWTLVYEVFFYGVCALLCFRRNWFPWVLLIWLAAVCYAFFARSQFGSVMQPTFVHIPFSLWNVGFICGGLAGAVGRRIRLPAPAVLWLTGLTLFLLSFAMDAALRIFMAGPGIGCVVLALTRAPQADRPQQPGLPMRILYLLGEYSYGMYLAHALSIQIALQFVPPSSDALHIYVAMLGVGLAVGISAGMVDVSNYRRLKTWIDSHVPATPKALETQTPQAMQSGGTR